MRSSIITSGLTKGCNNKIKVLINISFGIRNFKRFRREEYIAVFEKW